MRAQLPCPHISKLPVSLLAGGITLLAGRCGSLLLTGLVLLMLLLLLSALLLILPFLTLI